MSGGAPATSGRRSIVLPVEIKSREFDSMLLLGCVLAERGQDVVLGNRNTLKKHVHRLPRSVYLGKTVTGDVLPYYSYLEDLGHAVVCLDEEGLVIYTPDLYVRRRVDRRTLQSARALFAWGPSNADIWRACLAGDGVRIHETGNPRIDVIRRELRAIHEPETEELRERYGDYVLFNSNFQWVNTMRGERTRLPHPDDVEAGRATAPKNYDPDLARYRIGNFEAYLRALPRLADAFPELSFIFRPHPGENPDAWREAVSGHANGHVIHEKSAIPWILGARALLHHSCTTAVEAFVLERPSISYRPDRHDAFDPPLPIRLSHEAGTEEELHDLVARAVRGELSPTADAGRRRHLGEHITALDGRLACDRLADLLIDLPLLGRRRPGQVLRSVAKRVRKRVIRLRKGAPDEKSLAWRRHLFPAAPLPEVHARAARMGELLGRFGGVVVEERTEGIFSLRRR